jgi:hypothetical protein
MGRSAGASDRSIAGVVTILVAWPLQQIDRDPDRPG